MRGARFRVVGDDGGLRRLVLGDDRGRASREAGEGVPLRDGAAGVIGLQYVGRIDDLLPIAARERRRRDVEEFDYRGGEDLAARVVGGIGAREDEAEGELARSPGPAAEDVGVTRGVEEVHGLDAECGEVGGRRQFGDQEDARGRCVGVVLVVEVAEQVARAGPVEGVAVER